MSAKSKKTLVISELDVGMTLTILLPSDPKRKNCEATHLRKAVKEVQETIGGVFIHGVRFDGFDTYEYAVRRLA